MSSIRIAVIAGDGIGKEVIPAGIAALGAAVRGSGVSLSFEELPWSCDYYLTHQRMMDEDGFDRLSAFDAIYLGALGAPGVSDVASAGLILAIRQRFDQYVNLRPMRLLAGLSSPLANRSAADIDMICVRENSEGEYAGVGAGSTAARRTRLRSRRASSHGMASSGSCGSVRACGKAAAQDARQRRPSPMRSRIRWSCGTRSRQSCASTIPGLSTGSTTSTRSPPVW